MRNACSNPPTPRSRAIDLARRCTSALITTRGATSRPAGRAGDKPVLPSGAWVEPRPGASGLSLPNKGAGWSLVIASKPRSRRLRDSLLGSAKPLPSRYCAAAPCATSHPPHPAPVTPSTRHPPAGHSNPTCTGPSSTAIAAAQGVSSSEPSPPVEQENRRARESPAILDPSVPGQVCLRQICRGETQDFVLLFEKSDSLLRVTQLGPFNSSDA